MPKSLYIDPDKILHQEAKSKITFPEVPVMTYDKTVKQELD